MYFTPHTALFERQIGCIIAVHPTMCTAYHAKYFAYELTKRCASEVFVPERLFVTVIEPPQEEIEIPSGPTEKDLIRPMRLVQDFFRRSVKASYRFTCAFCGLNIPTLLTASHIIPWKASVELRADPRNGLCLCALHDRAFDRGLMAVDSDRRTVLSSRLKLKAEVSLHKAAFLDLKGREIILPEKFMPDSKSLHYHFNSIFR